MKIAIPYENGQVFQHFGHSAQFKLYTAEEGRITGAEVVSTDGQGHGALVARGMGRWHVEQDHFRRSHAGRTAAHGKTGEPCHERSPRSP